MTPQEAIRILEIAKAEVEWNYPLDYGIAIDTAIKALKFKEYFDELYEKELEIANWHLNGELEAFETFYDEAMARGYREEENND